MEYERILKNGREKQSRRINECFDNTQMCSQDTPTLDQPTLHWWSGREKEPADTSSFTEPFIIVRRETGHGQKK